MENEEKQSFVRLTRDLVDKTRPKCGPRAACGPPTHFCGPWCFFGLYQICVENIVLLLLFKKCLKKIEVAKKQEFCFTLLFSNIYVLRRS